MTHINLNPGMAPNLSFVAEPIAAPVAKPATGHEPVAAPEPRAAKPTDNLTCLTIKTGNPDCLAYFYPALYQLTLVRNKAEEKVELGFSGSRLLERLAQNPGEVVSREDLLSHAWSDRVVGQGSLNQQIYTLRQILGDEKAREIIQTLPRRGYQLNPNCVELSVVTPVLVPPASVPPVIVESAPVIEAPEPNTATIEIATVAPARRWKLLASTAGIALVALGFIWHSTHETAPAPQLNLTYATQDQDELAALKPAGEQLRRHLQSLLKQPMHAIIGLHQNMLDITCLSQDGSARVLHFIPTQIAQLTPVDLRDCLP